MNKASFFVSTPALLAGLVALSAPSLSEGSVITNGSFETGDFTGWIPTDMAVPFDPLMVTADGTAVAFTGFGGTTALASHGGFTVTNGFDGSGPDVISLAQDIGVVAVGDLLEYDFRAGWDMSFGATIDRTFGVNIEPAGGGVPLLSFTDLTTAPVGSTVFDTGSLTASHDLSSLAGTAVRINFLWTIPESGTGPAVAQLDNVRISTVPEASETAIFCLGAVGLIGFRRRKRSSVA